MGQQGGAAGVSNGIGRFLLPVSECGYALESITDDLSPDPWPVAANMRRKRCTGVALNVAVGLLGACVAGQGARIMLFVGGPATSGPGRVAKEELKTAMRSHTDISKCINTSLMSEVSCRLSARAFDPLFMLLSMLLLLLLLLPARCVVLTMSPHFTTHCHDHYTTLGPSSLQAVKYYSELAETAVKHSQVIDIFACNLDQVGMLEMRPCAQKTGGLMILADSFSQSVFKESFRRVFQRFPDDGSAAPSDAGHLMMGFNAKMEVMTSPEFKVQGAIGPCSSTGRRGKCVSEEVVGEGNTDQWVCGGIMPSSTIAFYFEITNPSDNVSSLEVCRLPRVYVCVCVCVCARARAFV